MKRKKWPASKVKVWCEALSYMLVGLGGFSFVADHQNIAYALTLSAGAIDKFGPKLFGSPENNGADNQAV